LGWLKQFFALPASTRLNRDKNQDLLKASPVGDDRDRAYPQFEVFSGKSIELPKEAPNSTKTIIYQG
jgi:hypothetical protein